MKKLIKKYQKPFEQLSTSVKKKLKSWLDFFNSEEYQKNLEKAGVSKDELDVSGLTDSPEITPSDTLPDNQFLIGPGIISHGPLKKITLDKALEIGDDYASLNFPKLNEKMRKYNEKLFNDANFYYINSEGNSEWEYPYGAKAGDFREYALKVKNAAREAGVSVEEYINSHLDNENIKILKKYFETYQGMGYFLDNFAKNDYNNNSNSDRAYYSKNGRKLILKRKLIKRNGDR